MNEIGHDMQKLSMKNPVVEFYFGKVSENRIDGIFVINIDPRVDHIFL